MQEKVRPIEEEMAQAKSYTATGGETLKDVAALTGANYATLVRLNAAFVRGKLPRGTKVLLSLNATPDEPFAASTKTSKTTAEDESARAAASEAKKASQRQAAQSAINNADKEYRQEAAYANADRTHKINRLTEQMRVNRTKLEGDLARQKIADSSIAQNERNKLDKQEADQRESIDLQTAHKLEQLERKRDKTKETQSRKLAGL